MAETEILPAVSKRSASNGGAACERSRCMSAIAGWFIAPSDGGWEVSFLNLVGDHPQILTIVIRIFVRQLQKLFPIDKPHPEGYLLDTGDL